MCGGCVASVRDGHFNDKLIEFAVLKKLRDTLRDPPSPGRILIRS